MILLALWLPAQLLAEKSIYIPTFSGTVRARYEYLTNQDVSAFKVPTLRLGLIGYVAPIMSYNAEVDFSDWGKIVLVNGFVKVTPVEGLSLSLGQQRMPFTVSAHRQPCEQYFVSRNFIAKYGGVRDLGFVAGYSVPRIPLTFQASVFNSSGLIEHKIYFTNSYGFSAKLISPFARNWYLAASTARVKKGDVWTQNWDVGAYFDNGLWHVEGEYLRRNYIHGLFDAVNACDFFVYRYFPIDRKLLGGLSGALRYDYMGDHSGGKRDEKGHLNIDDFERHRLTGGVTLSLASKFQADIRLNYEKYFFDKGVVPGRADDDRLVLEVIAHF